MAKRPKKPPTTRIVEMVVRVRVPARYGAFHCGPFGALVSAADARREVRCLITHQAANALDPGDVRVVSVRPVPKGVILR